ncbi:hypothetical protein [Streptomyces cyaneofuscatus]|uniref:hypothetical protein n=1 Tax=Streptomyces cyaneofuscatus TaxID=66883 RepID=UPI0033AD89AD
MTFAPRLWTAGETVSAAMLNTEIRDQFNSMFAAWTSWSPTWTSTGTNPTLGNGALAGRHMKVGRTVHVLITLTWGSTTVPGTGSYLFSLPFPGAAAIPGVLGVTCNTTGSVNYIEGSAPLGNGATTTGNMWLANPSVTGDWNAWAASAPTLAAGDVIRVYGTYQSAS